MNRRMVSRSGWATYRRAAEAGLSRLKFQQGDACNLDGVADHPFDLALSVFGAFTAPEATARRSLRHFRRAIDFQRQEVGAGREPDVLRCRSCR
jgi:hypothetical protein